MKRGLLCILCVMGYMSCERTGHAQSMLERVFPAFDDSHELLIYEAPSTYYMSSWRPFEGLAVVRTLDGGVTWETLAVGLGGDASPERHPAAWAYAVARSDPSVMYRTAGGLQQSTDGGATWLDLTPPLVTRMPDRGIKHVTVSPTDPFRIAYHDSAGGYAEGATYLDLTTGHTANVPAWAVLWTHPETGAVYYNVKPPDILGRYQGVVDFANETLVDWGGGWFETGGRGFASDDPTRLYTISRSLGATREDEPSPIQVYDAPRPDPPLYTFDTLDQYLSVASSFAVDTSRGVLYVGGSGTGGRPGGIFASRDGGERWKRVGEFAGRLFFLSAADALYVQSGRLYRLSLGAGVEATGKVAVTWGFLKRP